MQKSPARLNLKAITAIIIVSTFATLFSVLMAYLKHAAAGRRADARWKAAAAEAALAEIETHLEEANASIDAAKDEVQDKFWDCSQNIGMRTKS